MLTQAANIKKKDFLNFKNEVYQVSTAEFYHPGKGRTVMRTKLKNVNSGRTVEQVFTSNEMVEILSVSAVPCQFTYSDGQTLHFMHALTFEEYEVEKKIIGELSDFFKEGQEVFLLMLDEKIIGIRPPKSVTLSVIEAEDAVKGDTATNAKKQVVLETGAKILVPLFIKKGEKINLNPETKEYQGREN